MRLLPVSRKLHKSAQTCPLTNNKYISLDTLQEMSTWPAIKELLKENNLEDRIERVRKVIAAILLICNSEDSSAIKDVLSEDITDEDLPLSRYGNPPLSQKLQSRCKKKIFKSFTTWDPEDVEDFLESQSMLLEPQLKLDPSGSIDIPLEKQGALEIAFSSFKEINKTPHSTVYKCELHPRRQDGSDSSAKLKTPACIALKQFDRHQKSRFSYEKKVLYDIRAKGIKSDHLITHLAVCDQVPCILFPWADGGDLAEFWQCKGQKGPSDFIWSLQQLVGLAQAPEALHCVNTRHGDLKPANILYFNEQNGGMLKIADLGIARDHNQATEYRRAGTITSASTEAYQGPEIHTKDKPRSRRYDCWSMGCIALEFVVWLLYDFQALESFYQARNTTTHAYYRIITIHYAGSEQWDKAEVHPMVNVAIDCLRDDPRCSNTALMDLVNLVDKSLLQINPQRRLEAVDLRQKLEVILQSAKNDQSFLKKVTGHRPPIPSIFNQPPSCSPPQTTIEEKLRRSETLFTRSQL